MYRAIPDGGALRNPWRAPIVVTMIRRLLMRVLRSLVLAVLAALTLAGCSMFKGSVPTNIPPRLPKALDSKSSLAFPVNRTFVAVSYKDQIFKDDRPSILVSSSNRGTGFSACNNWSATIVTRADQHMAVGPVAISKRVCDARLMHNEQVFLYVLRTAQSWSYDGKTLTLAGPYGAMTFEVAA
jgi:heat shock protein HslJ